VEQLPARDRVDSLLGERKPDVVTVDGWHAIDARELDVGREKQRPRVKLASREDLLAAART
jgi:ferredoxin--NADP+ reductase